MYRKPGAGPRHKGPVLIDSDEEVNEEYEEVCARTSRSRRTKEPRSSLFQSDDERLKKRHQTIVKSQDGNIQDDSKGNGDPVERHKLNNDDIQSLVQRVCSALSLHSVPDNVPCREEQEREIRARVLLRLRSRASEMIYLSGQPGTGKTLTVHRVLEKVLKMRDEEKLEHFDFVSINALNDLPTPHDLFSRLYASLTQKILPCVKAAKELQKRYFSQRAKKDTFILLVVDELDALLAARKGTSQAKGQQVLHTLCEWVSIPGSCLLVIGIANTMDLSERMMQRTQSRFTLHPIVFSPYREAEVSEILKMRLKLAGASSQQDSEASVPLFASNAIDLCAKKTASVSGDIRRAMQVCKLAVERARSSLLDGTLKEIGISEMSECLREMRCTPLASLVENASKFEKLFLIALVKEMHIGGRNETTFDSVYNRVTLMCQSSSVVTAGSDAPSIIELPSATVWERVCNSLISCHLLTAKQYRERRYRVLSVAVAEPDDILFHLKASNESFPDPLITAMFTMNNF